MSREQMKRIVRSHYELTRPVTEAELDAELAMLQRKAANGSLCDLSGRLYARLDLGKVQS